MRRIYNNLTFEEFANDKKTVLSVTKCIEVVGEATKHISGFGPRKISRTPMERFSGIQR
jgi:uncharacterized protein with HEPN domain